MKPRFFANAAAFRKWLDKHHQSAPELVVGFYKVGSGKASMSWPESVDEALCFGWIDGVRTSIDGDSYQIRFTPRKANSIWSAVNIKKVGLLTERGLMQPAGLERFSGKNVGKTKLYSHELKAVELSAEYEQLFKADKVAWRYFEGLAASYRKSSANWVMSAKQEPTRLKRLNQLIADSAAGTNQWKDNKYMKQ